ncbi:MAG: tetratricopeptide repeat protein [Vicinamibacterales bacterium]
MLDGYVPFISALIALLVGVAIGKAWERYKLRDGRWIDRRKARDSHHYVLGLNYLVANQIDLAIEELSQAARVDADALEIHLILGNVYRERGQVSRAIQVHQSLLQRQKLTRLEHAYVMLCLGLDYKRGGFVDRAVEAFKEARRLDPANAYALLHLEKVYEEQRQWEEAAKVRQELIAMAGPESPARGQTILAFLENERGLAALKAGDLGGARSRFAHALDLDAAVTPALVNLGDTLARQGDTADAVRRWEGLVEQAPERSHLVLDRLRDAYTAAGHPERFLDLCRRVAASQPHNWRARLALGGALARQGQPDAALDQYLEALSHNPHGLTVHEAIWDLLLGAGLDRASVERYVTHAKAAVFYLDPHVCLRCHYRSTELLWQCPHCHEWNTFVEERIAPVTKDAAEI